jgi:hypothetical protein
VPKQLPGAAPVDPVACAELAIKVTFTLSTGLLAAEARLTENSFVFSKECKLRGGFALYCWFDPEHAGERATVGPRKLAMMINYIMAKPRQ